MQGLAASTLMRLRVIKEGAKDTVMLNSSRALRPILSLYFGIVDGIDSQRGRLFLWLPVLLAVGIGLFFAAANEPSKMCLWSVAGLAALGWGASAKVPPVLAPLLIALAVMASGYALAGFRAHSIAAPVLNFRYYGPIEGRVVKIDRSASDALRLTLDQVVLKNTPPKRTPNRVRVSLHSPPLTGMTPFETQPGQILMLTGHLSPPPSPSEPGGFDFQRMAWFDQLGAVGYTRTPVLKAGKTNAGLLLRVYRLRQSLSNALQSRINGQAGAFAAAILTGDRSGISPQTADHLRSANLSHLLAISGLHMGLLTGVVFSGIRLVLVCIPYTFLRWPNKKIAAVCALIAGGFYLMLSGWNVATERAYIMVSLMFIAILCDRIALSFRTVALAALVILTLRPEVLVEPGFQMSFAATTALVAVFQALRQNQWMLNWPRWLNAMAAVVLSSAVAGLATAPVSAAHFNRIADFGLIANVISVPAMGALVMPCAVIAGVLAPLGLELFALAIAELGIRWILWVAGTVSGWDGAVTRIPAPSQFVLPFMALGGLFVVLWRGKWNGLGLLPILLGSMLWIGGERPNLLVSADGGLVGRLTAEGRALNKSTGAGFSAQTWLENDGDIPVQSIAAERAMPVLDVGNVRIAHVTGRGWRDRLPDVCAKHDVVILNQVWDGAPLEYCILFDAAFLRQSGALAMVPHKKDKISGGIEVTTALGASGLRLWNSAELRTASPRTAKKLRPELQQKTLGMIIE
jgi:competence protein ComEC